MTAKQKLLYAAGALFAGFTLYSAFIAGPSHETHDRQPQDNTATELPAGPMADWSSIVDQRLSQRITGAGTVLKIEDSAAFGEHFVSKNMPYSISCSDYGITVSFGAGDNADDVDIVALYKEKLSVGARSPAAVQLLNSLCPRVVAYMSTVTAP